MSLLTSTWSENFGQSSKAREPIRPGGEELSGPGCQDPDNKNDGLMGAAQLLLGTNASCQRLFGTLLF